MGITDSIYLQGEVVDLTFDFCKTELLQNIKYEIGKDGEEYFKDPISQRILLDLNNNFVTNFGQGIYHFKSETGKSASCFKITEKGMVSKVSHLYIKWDSGEKVILHEEDNILYKSLLINLKSNAKNLMVRVGNEFIMFSTLDIDKLFSLQNVTSDNTYQE